MLADVRRGPLDAAVGGVRLRGQRQVDGCLSEVEPALGQAHPVDRLGGGVGDHERLRVGVADVLGGQDHHPPGDEAGVLAALEHHRQVVQRGVGVGGAGGLDPGRDVVVVAVALAVVGERLALERVLGGVEVDRMALSPRRLHRPLERRERHPGVAAGAGRRAAPAPPPRPPAGPRSRARDRRGRDRSSWRRCSGVERTQLVELRATEKRRVDLEVGVLGGRPDQRHQPLLDRRQQRVLLRLVEAMDLVEEEDRRLVRGPAALVRALDHGANLGAAGVDRRELLERPAAGGGDDPRQGRLPGARRPVEDRRVGLPGLDRGAQRRPLAQQVLLPDELLQRARSHPHRQGRLRRRNARSVAWRVAGVEQPLHPRSPDPV